ncbi:MAG: hypothetical protein KAW14_00575 [Candidatus Aegiribacteria sp.]|nr:hypothetical protein [Candidatus Aegiribacteria sp.]
MKVKLRYRRFDIILGILIYSSGDTAASLVLSEFSIWRLLGMMFIGGTVYAFEIPNYFRWIDYRTGGLKGMQVSLLRTGLAFLYFNPLWIARHLLFIQVFSGNWGGISFNLLKLGLYSFLVNIPITFIANYAIQNRISLKWRFLANAVFSSLMVFYYALSKVLFG